MTTAIEDEDLDYDEEPPDARFLQPRPSLIPTGDVDKEAERRAQRVSAAQAWRRKCDAVCCGVVVLAIATVLVFITYKILMSPEPDLSLTYVVRSTSDPLSRYNDSNVGANVTLPQSLEELDVLEEGGPWEPMNGAAEDAYLFCSTEACKNLAAYFEALLGTERGNRCASLYDHVCTRWSRGHRHLAVSRGHYAVDDDVLDDTLGEVGRLLSEPETALLDQRAFYSDCVAGRLMEEQDLEGIIGDLVSLSGEFTPASLAEVIVRMARIGVSPFFDVSVGVGNDTFNARLVNSEALPMMRFLRKDPQRNHVGRPHIGKEGHAATTRKHSSRNSTEFFRSLEREMCIAIAQMANLSAPCTLSVDSFLSERGYDWYASNGPAHLAAAVASMLEDLSAYRKEFEETFNTLASFRITTASKQERLTRCLRFIDQRDPALVPHIVTARLAPWLEADVSDVLGQLKAHLDKKMPNASIISIAFLSAGLGSNDSFPYPHSEDLYGNDPASNVSRLRRFLETSTWKRWTGSFSSRTSSLSPAATFLDSSSILQVPIGLFNLTMLRDEWLRDLSLARAGPRVLGALFHRALSRELKATNFFNCVSKRAAVSGRVGGRRFAGATRMARYPFSIRGFRSERAELQLDIEELAAFYVSLQAYRSRVGDAVAIPGSLLNSDSLFLLYYVYSNCLTESGGKAGGDDLYGDAGDGAKRALSFGSRRRRVDSVAAMFGGLLLDECQTISDLSVCEVESEDKF